MPTLQSRLNTRAADYTENAAHMQAQVDDLKEKIANIKLGGDQKARDRHLSRGKLLPRDRVLELLDPGTPFLELSQLAAMDVYGEDVNAAGIITGVGMVSKKRERKGEDKRPRRVVAPTSVKCLSLTCTLRALGPESSMRSKFHTASEIMVHIMFLFCEIVLLCS